MYKLFINSIFLDVVFNQTKAFLLRYPAPTNIGYLWNFGSLSGIFLVVQILTGLFLTMFYSPHTDLAFLSVDHIMRDINNGWFIRYIHANGASFFFMFIYVHMLRGLFFSSYQYPRTNVWFTGVTIYLLLMGTAFLGYVLPWGQMSFWAATVITNFITVIPFIGEYLVYWVWGGFSINNATLNRFFCLHYLLPFVILILVVIHLMVLHQSSSNNELRLRSSLHNRISFYPYFAIKDLLTLLYAFFFFGFVVFFYPELFNHSVNYIAANLLVTPSHIVPEWYFLPYYAILRSILNKTIGICAMLLSIIIFYLFPIIDCGIGFSRISDRSYRRFFWFFFFNFVFLGFLGSETAEYPCVEFGTFCTLFYLILVFLIMPFLMFSNSLLIKIKRDNAILL
jgi:ubiquinol-cytochrome c reductase cytochrome b subunit